MLYFCTSKASKLSTGQLGGRITSEMKQGGKQLMRMRVVCLLLRLRLRWRCQWLRPRLHHLDHRYPSDVFSRNSNLFVVSLAILHLSNLLLQSRQPQHKLRAAVLLVLSGSHLCSWQSGFLRLYTMRQTEEMPAPPRQSVSCYTICVDVHIFLSDLVMIW